MYSGALQELHAHEDLHAAAEAVAKIDESEVTYLNVDAFYRISTMILAFATAHKLSILSLYQPLTAKCDPSLQKIELMFCTQNISTRFQQNLLETCLPLPMPMMEKRPPLTVHESNLISLFQSHSGRVSKISSGIRAN